MGNKFPFIFLNTPKMRTSVLLCAMLMSMFAISLCSTVSSVQNPQSTQLATAFEKVSPMRQLRWRKCNVKLNTSKGQRRGRCGPRYNKTVCAVGYCSRWGWCGFSRLHKWRRSWRRRYDRSAARRSCFAKVTKKAIRRSVRAIKKSKAKFLKKAKKSVGKSKNAKKPKRLTSKRSQRESLKKSPKQRRPQKKQRNSLR